jgi:hypothetical protein
VPSLDLRFAENKSLVDATTGANLVTFTRASSGTFVGADGLIKTATTNLLLRSEEFQTFWGVTNSSVSADTSETVSPTGLSTADKLTASAGSALKAIFQGITSATGTYTFSVYAKKSNHDFIQFFYGGTGQDYANFNISTGATGTTVGTSSIASIGNGWYRCVHTFTASANTSINIALVDASTSARASSSSNTNAIYLWGAQLEQASTVGEYIPTTSTINSAPRFDHNPTTGESLGLLVEEQRTNSIRNNTMVGAVAGTPGTLPTNWSSSAGNGIAVNVIGTGTENGISYIDLRFVGTATATSQVAVRFDGTANMSALASTAYTGTVYVRRVSGSNANLNSVLHYLVARNSGASNIGDSNVNITSSLGASSLNANRQAITYTTPALTTTIQHDVRIDFNNSAVIDITLRIGLPQLEQGAFATSVIPTSGTAVTRSADVASITGTNFSSWYRQDEGTVFASYQFPAGSAVNTNSRQLFDSSDGTTNNRFSVRGIGGASTADQITVRSGASTVAQFSTNGTAPGTAPRAIAAVYRLDDYAAVATGSTSAVTDTSGALPVGLNQANIGGAVNGTEYLSGTIKRLTYWPTRLPNTTLQQITQ